MDNLFFILKVMFFRFSSFIKMLAVCLSYTAVILKKDSSYLVSIQDFYYKGMLSFVQAFFYLY